jgi:hypothetical protein
MRDFLVKFATNLAIMTGITLIMVALVAAMHFLPLYGVHPLVAMGGILVIIAALTAWKF